MRRPGHLGPAALGGLLLAALLAGPSVRAHVPVPALEWQARLLGDQNDDREWIGAGHDLVALDAEEAWIPEEGQARLVLRLVLGKGYTSLYNSGTLREEFTITVNGRTVTPRLFTTDDASFRAEGWDFVGKAARPKGEGHGDLEIKLGLDYRTLGIDLAQVEAGQVRVTEVSVLGWHEAEKRDLMVGGYYKARDVLSGQQEYVSKSRREAEEPISQVNLPYRLRGPGAYLALEPEKSSIAAAPGLAESLNLTLRNKLVATNQSVELRVLEKPAGWSVELDAGPHEVCAPLSYGEACNLRIPVRLAAANDARSGDLRVEALGTFPGLAGASRAVATLRLEPVLPEAPLEIRDLHVEPGATRAEVRWTTPVPADSLVEWGPTRAYGQMVRDEALVRDHRVAVAGLEPATTYHLRVASSNGSQVARSDDTAFTTLPAPRLAFLRPLAGDTVQGEILVRLDVRNWSGPVELLLDGERLATLPGPPYEHPWDTRRVPDGPHRLGALAGGFEAQELEVTVENMLRDPGRLTEGKVSPISGTEDELFTFSVLYTGAEDDLPAKAEVVIDGQRRALVRAEGEPLRGLRLEHRTRLATGSHEFYFVVVNSEGTLRFPERGALPGPFVEAAAGHEAPPADRLNATEAERPPPEPVASQEPREAPSPARSVPAPSAALALLALAGSAVLRAARRSPGLAVVLAGLALTAALAAPLAAAHQTLHEGDLTFIVGWAREPSVAGERNDVEITALQGGEPVAGLTTVRAWVLFGPDQFPLELEPRAGKVGVYDGALIPTMPGQYRVRLAGTVGETSVNLTFDEVETVQPASDLEFPPRTAGREEAELARRLAALEERVAELETAQAEGPAASPSVPAPGTGALLLGFAVAALAAAHWRRVGGEADERGPTTLEHPSNTATRKRKS